MSNNYSKEWFDEKCEIFEKAYFGNSNEELINNLGITVSNQITEKYEDETIVERHLKEGIIDDIVVAWKAGRIDSKGVIAKKGQDYLNGYGCTIYKKQLDNYLKYVNDIWGTVKESEFYEIYKEMVHNVPHNFGCVYIINLIYFLSKGNWPIYDKFAHKAVKAIYMEKNPCEIWVGDAPGKNEIKKVVNMYEEYCWLLEKVFKNKKIERKVDRALWTYGHATKKPNDKK